MLLLLGSHESKEVSRKSLKQQIAALSLLPVSVRSSAAKAASSTKPCICCIGAITQSGARIPMMRPHRAFTGGNAAESPQRLLVSAKLDFITALCYTLNYPMPSVRALKLLQADDSKSAYCSASRNGEVSSIVLTCGSWYVSHGQK